jgi:hypothetical protein
MHHPVKDHLLFLLQKFSSGIMAAAMQATDLKMTPISH